MDAARQEDVVIDMANYLEETIKEMDGALSHWQAKRQELGLAVIRAATDEAVGSAVADYDERLADDRPYEGAEDITQVLAEAYRRYGS